MDAMLNQRETRRNLEIQELNYAYIEGKHFKMDYESDSETAKMITALLTNKLALGEVDYIKEFLRGFHETLM